MASAGTRAVIWVAVSSTVKLNDRPFHTTLVALPRCVPVIVMVLPALPVAVTALIVGGATAKVSLVVATPHGLVTVKLSLPVAYDGMVTTMSLPSTTNDNDIPFQITLVANATFVPDRITVVGASSDGRSTLNVPSGYAFTVNSVPEVTVPAVATTVTVS